jgi:hypothetical protein
VEVPGLLNWGGASAVVAVAVARARPLRRRPTRVRREPIELDLVRLHGEEVAMDGWNTGDRPMAMSTEMPMPSAPGANGTSPTGLPPEQLYTWLEWVQDDLRRIESRLEYLEAARSQLREQERLLSELLRSAGPLTRS